jgi:Protein of unknown function (DUF3999)
MNYALLIVSLLLGSMTYAGNNTLIRSTDFAQHTRIHLSGSEPFQQLTLPAAVYQGLQRNDLGDIRVFNGQGEALPYAVMYPDPPSTSSTQEISLPLFTLTASIEQNKDTSMEIRRNPDGTLITFKQSNTSAPKGSYIRGIILDISQITDASYALRLETETTTRPFHPFTLESSDDLQQWHPLAEGQVVRLQQANEHIEKSTVEWHTQTGKYLRLLWTYPEQAPHLTAAFISTLHTTHPIPPMIWSSVLIPLSTQKNIYDYAIQGHFPLERIRIHLPQLNTLTPAQLQRSFIAEMAHHRTQTRWNTLSNTVIFRLKSPHGEILSSDILLNAPAEKQLRLVIDERSGGIGTQPPSLQIGFTPHTLIFLARGKEPFTLAWGAAQMPNAALPAEILLPNPQEINAATATLEPITLITKPMIPSSSISEKKDTRYILWMALIGGVLILGSMTWKLIAQIKKD